MEEIIVKKCKFLLTKSASFWSSPARWTLTDCVHDYRMQERPLSNTIYNAGMALVRRSALPADDNYTQYRYCGDWLFWIQIVSGGGNVVYLAEPLNYYRVHDSNTTAESIVTGRKHIETLRILEETFRLIDPPLICRLSIAGKHLLRIRKAAGSHWNEEPYLSVRLAWRERYRHPRMIMFWHKVFKDLPRSFSR